MVTLAGKSRIAIEATIAEMEFVILSRSDYDGASQEQVRDYHEYVTKAVRLVCHTCPEYVVPCQMVRDADALGANMVGSMSIDGELVLQEVQRGGGDKRRGNC